MMEIQLQPSLSHCVQTLAKAEYDRLKNEILDLGEADIERTQKIEMMRVFLESTDFSKLRSEYEPSLVAGKRVTFTLRLMDDTTEYEMEIV